MCIYVHLQEWQVGCFISRHSKGFLFSFLFNSSPSFDLMIFCSEYKVLPHQSAAELNFLVVFNPVNFKHNFLLKIEKRKRVSSLLLVALDGCTWQPRKLPTDSHKLLKEPPSSGSMMFGWESQLLKSINWTKMNLFASTQSDYDLQVTGILAKQLDLDHKELNSYWTMNSSRLMATKLQQSPLTYHKDLVAGPTDRCGK